MSNRPSSFPASARSPLLDRHYGRITAFDELPVSPLGDDYTLDGSGIVTRLPSLAAGTMITLKVNGAPTFFHSARLLCPGGRSFVASPGDLLLARSDGEGVWRLYALRGTGVTPAYASPSGRLTLTSGTPVLGASVAAATRVYYTPYVGDMVPIYDGYALTPVSFPEIYLDTTDTTKSPAAVAASSNYDVFCWIDPLTGLKTLSRGPAWTSSTARGYTLTAINGILVNTAAITNGPAAMRGTWVGTIRSNATSTIDFIFGASGTGGVAAQLMIWNAYNRVLTPAKVTDTNSFTSSSNTIQMFDNATGMYVDFVLGAQTDSIAWSFATEITLLGVSGARIFLGVGFDTTGAFSEMRDQIANPTATSFSAGSKQAGNWSPSIGRHFLSFNQQGDGTNANQFNNTGKATLAASLWM